jgi:hypothetical protein
MLPGVNFPGQIITKEFGGTFHIAHVPGAL